VNFSYSTLLFTRIWQPGLSPFLFFLRRLFLSVESQTQAKPPRSTRYSAERLIFYDLSFPPRFCCYPFLFSKRKLAAPRCRAISSGVFSCCFFLSSFCTPTLMQTVHAFGQLVAFLIFLETSCCWAHDAFRKLSEYPPFFPREERKWAHFPLSSWFSHVPFSPAFILFLNFLVRLHSGFPSFLRLFWSCGETFDSLSPDLYDDGESVVCFFPYQSFFPPPFFLGRRSPVCRSMG